jgi:hypothetical protein
MAGDAVALVECLGLWAMRNMPIFSMAQFVKFVSFVVFAVESQMDTDKYRMFTDVFWQSVEGQCDGKIICVLSFG